MVVVCDTSPIIALAGVGQLDLLRGLYTQILVPNAVYHEATVAGAGEAGSREIAAAPWVKCRPVRNTSLVTALRLELDDGEAEAIALAVESSAGLILLDERRGRRAAQHLGLRVVGTLGVLIAAKDSGLLAAVRPVLQALRVDAGFWIADDLFNTVVVAAGE